MTTTRVCGSAAARERASSNADISAADSALRASGRLRVRRKTPRSFSSSRTGALIVILAIAVIAVLPLPHHLHVVPWVGQRQGTLLDPSSLIAYISGFRGPVRNPACRPTAPER